MPFAAKTHIEDPDTGVFDIIGAKTMYDGKSIREGDAIFIFASENEGGAGLIARGIVTKAASVPKVPGVARQTPRVSISVQRTDHAKRRLGRNELKAFTDWTDGRPETELNFKFHRQATNKIVRLSETTSAFLATFF